MVSPRPGDFAVITSRSAVGALVRLAQALSDPKPIRSVLALLLRHRTPSEYSHACICSRVDDDGTVWIVEAMPGGAQEVRWHYDDSEALWSTGILDTPEAAGTAALRYVGWKYGWLDYLVIAQHCWHLDRITIGRKTWWLPWAVNLAKRYARTHTIICSQLVDAAELDAGDHLFADGRPPGFVRPEDLAGLLLRA